MVAEDKLNFLNFDDQITVHQQCAGDLLSMQWAVQLLEFQKTFSVKAERDNSSGQHTTRKTNSWVCFYKASIVNASYFFGSATAEEAPYRSAALELKMTWLSLEETPVD